MPNKSAPSEDDKQGANQPHLSISAHVVKQLGEELVTDLEQALLELAKNAYDADSDDCEIVVEPEWELLPEDPIHGLLFSALPAKDRPKQIKVGRLRVRDYGTGISEKSITEGWLRISSSIKRANKGESKKLTKKGRTPVGDKGLGRLATMKVGDVLRLKTAIEGETKWRTVTFSWNDFTEDRALDEVLVLQGTDEEEYVDSPGTFIEIVNLRDRSRWASKDFVEKQLIPKLSSLVNPFPKTDRFDISLKVGPARHELDSLSNEVLNLAAAHFEFNWDGQKLTQKGYFAKSLFKGEKGEENEKKFNALFSKHFDSLKEWLLADKKLKARNISFDVPKPWLFSLSDEVSGTPFPEDRELPGAIDPGPFSGEFYYFLFHEDIKQKLVHANKSTATLQAMSQIAIYRDGFRVRAQKDWLRLSDSATKGSSYYELRPANVIGHFDLTNAENPSLVEKSDREGFVENPSYLGFLTLGLRARDFANAALEATRVTVKKFRRTIEIGDDLPPTRKQLTEAVISTQREAASKLKDLERDLNLTKDALEKVQGLPSSIDTDDASGALQAPIKHMQEYVVRAATTLRDMEVYVEKQGRASILMSELGGDNEEYAHRLLDAAAVGLAARSLSHELHSYLRMLREAIGAISAANKIAKNPEITRAANTINTVTRELAKSIATLDPMLPGSRTIKESIDLGVFVSEYIESRKPVAEKAGITIHLDSQNSLIKVKFSRARLTQVFENLFQNSLYWIKKGPLPKSGIKEILVTINESGFTWADSGPGVKNSISSIIFEPYVSDKASSEASGLGLHVVSSFLEFERCSIQLAPETNPLGRMYRFIVDLSGALLTQDDQTKLVL